MYFKITFDASQLIHICHFDDFIASEPEISETLGLDHFPGLGLGLGLKNKHFSGLGLSLSLKYS